MRPRHLSALPLLLALVCLSPLAAAQDEDRHEIGWRWREGARYEIRYTSAQTLVMNQAGGGKVKQAITYSGVTIREVERVDAKGIAALVDKPKHIVCTIENPFGEATIDTRKPGIAGKPDPMTMMVATKLRAVIGKPIHTRIDALGKVHAMKMPGFRGTAAVMKQMTRLSLMTAPKTKVAVGGRWSGTYDIDLVLMARLIAAQVTERCRLLGKDEQRPTLLAIEVAQKVTPRAVESGAPTTIDVKQSEGHVLFDPVRGQLVDNKVDTHFVIKSAGLVMDQTMRATVDVRALPAAEPAKAPPEDAE